ncbi:Maf family protein, partial [Streptomyces heliomycini]
MSDAAALSATRKPLPDTARPVLCLASASPRRRELLASIGVTVAVRPVDIDETPRPGEGAIDYVTRLAREKALAGAGLSALPTLGSDTAVVCDGEILGKPADEAAARRQLARFSGQRVRFLTGLALLDTRRARHRVTHETYDVMFRRLEAGEIARYVEKEKPLECAGSFRMEGLGITLFERLEGDDPNT